MSKSLLLAAAAILLAVDRSVQTKKDNSSKMDLVVINDTRPARSVHKTANKIRVFMGYASDRKGKGQKKRDATARRSKGWL